MNIHAAKSSFSRLIAAVERGEASEVVIARNGVPVARLVPIARAPKPRLLGLAKGKYVIPDDIDALNPEIEQLFYGDEG